MISLNVNILAIVAARIVHQVLGFLWYGPLFGKTWLAAMGKKMDELGDPTRAIVISTISTFVMALALAILLTTANPPSLTTGILFGALAGIGLVATSTATTIAYEDRSTKVSLLFVGYQLVSLILMGAIIGAWT